MTQPTYTATAATRLAQDLLQSGRFLLKEASAAFSNVVATYTGAAGAARALALATDGFLYDIYRDPSTDSGWNVNPVVKSLGELAEVVCGTDQVSGTTWAFFTTAAGTLYTSSWDPAGTWAEPVQARLPNSATNLAVAYTAEEGALTLFALAANGTLSVVTAQNGAWSGNTITLAATSFSASAPPLVTFLSEEVWLLAYCEAGMVNLYEGQGTTTSSGSQLQLPGTAKAQQVVLAFRYGETTLLLVSDQSGALYSASYGAGAVPVALGNPMAVQNATGFTTADSFLVVGTDTTGTLWTFSPTGFDSDGAATWSPATPYVADVAAVSFDSALNAPQNAAVAGQEVFVVFADFTLALVQVGGTGQWRPLPVSQPTPGTQNSIVTYQLRISVVDQTNVAAPNLPLVLTASAPVYIWYSHAMSLLSSANPLNVQTDGFGGVTLSIPAFAATAPSITVSASGALLGTFYPDAQLHQYLSSSSSTESYLPDFGASSLTTATVHNPDGSAGALVASSLSTQPTLATLCAQTMSASSQSILAVQQNGATRRNDATATVGWISDFTAGYSGYTNSQAWTAAYTEAFGQPPSAIALPGSIFSFIGDVVTAIANGAVRVVKAAFEFGTHVLSLAIDYGEDLIDFIAGVIADPADIGPLFHALLQKAEAQTVDFLNWLAHFLPIQQIASAQKSILALVQAAPAEFAQAIRQAQTSVDAAIQNEKATLQKELTSLYAQWKDVSVSQLWSGNLPGAPASTPAVSMATILASPDAHWILSKISPGTGGEATAWTLPTPTSSMSSLTAQVASPPSEWQTVITDLEQVATALGDLAATLASPGDLTLGGILSDVSTLVSDILAFAQAVADLLMLAAADALDSVGVLFQQPILSVLGPLGSIISTIATLAGVTISVSLADVFSWIGAVAAVMIAWTITGNANIPFSGPASEASVLTGDPLLAVGFGVLGILAIFSTTLVDIADTTTPNGQQRVLLMIFFNLLFLYEGRSAVEAPNVTGYGRAAWTIDYLLQGFNILLAMEAFGHLSPPTSVYGPASTTLISLCGVAQSVLGGLNLSGMGTALTAITVSEVNAPLFVNGGEFLTIGGGIFAGALAVKCLLNAVCVGQLAGGMVVTA